MNFQISLSCYFLSTSTALWNTEKELQEVFPVGEKAYRPKVTYRWVWRF